MRFMGIWFNMDTEVKRDYVDASNADEASRKIHMLYAGKGEPAEALAVVPADGSKKHGGDPNGYYKTTTWR